MHNDTMSNAVKSPDHNHTSTREVLGGSYIGHGENRVERTHLVFVTGKDWDDFGDSVGCRQPLGNLVDAHGAGDVDAAPTCPTCLRKWNLLNK